MQAREFLSKLGDLGQTQIFAKIENTEVNAVIQIIFPWITRNPIQIFGMYVPNPYCIYINIIYLSIL